MLNNITKTKAQAMIEEIWSKEVVRDTNPKLVLAPLVWNFDKEAKHGDTIHVPSLSNLEANDKQPNMPVTLQAPTETNTDILIDQHKEVSYIIEDITELQSNRALRQMYTEPMTTAISRAIDTSLAELGAAVSQEVGSYNTALTTDVLLEGIEKLDENEVPFEDRHFIFKPDTKKELLQLNAYTSGDFVSGKPVETGLIGDLYGVKTYMSNNIVKAGDNTNNMLFHKQAFAIANAQKPRVQVGYELLSLGTASVCDAVWGVKEMRPDFAVLVKT